MLRPLEIPNTIWLKNVYSIFMVLIYQVRLHACVMKSTFFQEMSRRGNDLEMTRMKKMTEKVSFRQPIEM